MSLPNFSWVTWDRKDIIVFDKDGTLTMTKSGRPCPNDLDDIELLPNVKETLNKLHRQGVNLGLVTNQLGVELGYMTKQMSMDIINKTVDMLGVPFIEIKASFYKDDKENPPKPNGKMLFDIISTGYERFAHVGNEKVDMLALNDLVEKVGERYYPGGKYLMLPPVFLRADLFFHRGLETEIVHDVGWFYKEDLRRQRLRKEKGN